MTDHRNRPDFEQMADAARKAREAKLQEELDLVAGTAHYKFEDLYDTTELDHATKIARFKAATEVLDSASTTASVTSALSADEQELLEAFRSGRVIKTDQGAYRDTEWNTRHPRQPRATTPAATATPPGQPTAEPAAPASPPAPAGATPTAPEPTAPAVPEAPASPSEKAKGALARIVQAAKNAQQ